MFLSLKSRAKFLRAFVFLGLSSAAPKFAQSPLFSDLGDVATTAVRRPALFGEFNGDGALDLITGSGGYLEILFDVAGPIVAPASVMNMYGTLGDQPARAAAGDFDGDGDLDVFMTATTGGFLNMPPPPPRVVQVLVNNGTGGFTPSPAGPVAPPHPQEIPTAVASGDFNADGFADVAIHVWRSGYSNDELRVYLSNGSTFSQSYVFVGPVVSPGSIFNSPLDSVRTGDFNGDGHLDVAWLLGFTQPPQRSDVTIGYGDGLGGFTFSPFSTASVGTDAQIEAVADLDQDGRDDLVFNGVSGFINVIYGVAGNGIGFVYANSSGATAASGTAVADWDGDGILDFAVSAIVTSFPMTAGRRIVCMRGLGGRTFTTGAYLATPQFPSAGLPSTPIAATDRDGDGDPEFVLTHAVGPVVNLVRVASNAVYAPGCAGSGGVAPQLRLGTAQRGNASFAIGLTGAPPFALSLLGLSAAPAAGGACGVSVDLGALILPLPGPGATWANALGEASIALPIPSLPALANVAVYAQWAVMDPAGGLMTPGATFSASQAHTILIL